MKILQYVHYVYLVMAVLFAYDGIVRLQNGENALLSFLFAAGAVFMFFFRRHFSNKIKSNSK
ncbi:hypothetical protein FLJC2902T_01150 [Flavobacterium limnosediminis JC2902]|uniref:Uncharacterized protein n=1 Tax=Flavobacterium limnosediminis JC2902 TaxID=1341181 RepID=V6SSJ2_9FLAO|nr:hypothetical protein [Flavobacterium limnosediminis]ESU29643.1 hypothetical protein FLJC2902T_01150 [Flavobacterium limnosediminis JC2902]